MLVSCLPLRPVASVQVMSFLPISSQALRSCRSTRAQGPDATARVRFRSAPPKSAQLLVVSWNPVAKRVEGCTHCWPVPHRGGELVHQGESHFCNRDTFEALSAVKHLIVPWNEHWSMECVVSTCRFPTPPVRVAAQLHRDERAHEEPARLKKKRASAETCGSGSSVASRRRSRLGTRVSTALWFFFSKTPLADSETWLLGPRCCLLRPWRHEQWIPVRRRPPLRQTRPTTARTAFKLSGSLTTRVQLVDCMDVTGSPLRRVTDT